MSEMDCIVVVALKLLAVFCVACDCFTTAQLCSCITRPEMLRVIGLWESLDCTEWGKVGARQVYHRLVSSPLLLDLGRPDIAVYGLFVDYLVLLSGIIRLYYIEHDYART